MCKIYPEFGKSKTRLERSISLLSSSLLEHDQQLPHGAIIVCLANVKAYFREQSNGHALIDDGCRHRFEDVQVRYGEVTNQRLEARDPLAAIVIYRHFCIALILVIPHYCAIRPNHASLLHSQMQMHLHLGM